jgi:hypothetical protein
LENGQAAQEGEKSPKKEVERSPRKDMKRDWCIRFIDLADIN